MHMPKLSNRIVLFLAVWTALSGTSLLFAGQDPQDSKSPTQPATTPSPTVNARPENASAADLASLKKQIADQEAQIEQLLRSVQQLKTRIDEASRAAAPQPASGGDSNKVASLAPVLPKTPSAAGEPDLSASLGAPVIPSAAAAPNPQEHHAEESPLQLRVGSAAITPVGFMDFTGVVRSKTGGSGIGTNFASIPYGTTSATANLSEFRLNMQNSRIGFRVDADVKGAHVIGYMEADFLGNNPGNVAVSSNSNTLRSRLYWVDVRKSSWEVLGGQTWSLITPGRNGISPLPADIFYSQDMDVNYQAGLFWGRIPELRVVYHHPSNKAHFAIAIDSPEQYVGGSSGGSTITFPSALATTYGTELNTGGNTLGVPNVAPDVIAKLALEPSKKFHFEIGGVERNFKVYNPATKTTPAATYSAEGGGGFLNLNFELFKGFRVLTNNFVSDGGGRYIFGQAPDLIVHPDGSLSLIHADSSVTGFEYTRKNTMVYAYYGGLYVGRNTTFDTTAKTPAYVGYGYTGSPSSQNKSVQEGTFGIVQTFWKNPKYGALSLITQYSYLARNPWYVATGQPNNASLNMVFIDLRYTLPGSAPTLGKF